MRVNEKGKSDMKKNIKMNVRGRQRAWKEDILVENKNKNIEQVNKEMLYVCYMYVLVLNPYLVP